MSRDMVYEDVPRLDRRTGDQVLANQNNATILLGRDRVGTVEAGYGSLSSSTRGRGAGAIHLMVGRRSPDPSLSDDAATVYVSAMTDPDAPVGTSSIGDVSAGVSGVIVRADCVRIVPRRDLKVAVGASFVVIDGTSATVEASSISLGRGAADSAVLGSTYRSAEDTLFGAIGSLAGALEAYAAGIQTTADPSGAATAGLTAAVGSFQASLSTFQSAASSYLSKKNRLV